MNILTALKNAVVTAWDDFQAGLKWLTTEAAAIGAWLQKVDPAIAAQFQTMIQDGEAAAEGLAQYEGQALSGLIAGLIPDAETSIASILTNALGGNPAAVIASKGAAQVVADVGAIVQQVNQVALVKVVAGIASAATAAQGGSTAEAAS